MPLLRRRSRLWSAPLLEASRDCNSSASDPPPTPLYSNLQFLLVSARDMICTASCAATHEIASEETGRKQRMETQNSAPTITLCQSGPTTYPAAPDMVQEREGSTGMPDSLPGKKRHKTLSGHAACDAPISHYLSAVAQSYRLRNENVVASCVAQTQLGQRPKGSRPCWRCIGRKGKCNVPCVLFEYGCQSSSVSALSSFIWCNRKLEPNEKSKHTGPHRPQR